MIKKHFKKRLLDIIEEKTFEMIEFFKYTIKDDYITIYRGMNVDDNYLSHLEKIGKHLGIYWTYDENCAISYDYPGNDKSCEIIIESEINQKYINWFDTISLNIDAGGFGEKEIRLFKNTPLKIIRLYQNRKEMNNNNITNKIFYS
jgi:hypothetical protein